MKIQLTCWLVGWLVSGLSHNSTNDLIQELDVVLSFTIEGLYPGVEYFVVCAGWIPGQFWVDIEDHWSTQQTFTTLADTAAQLHETGIASFQLTVYAVCSDGSIKQIYTSALRTSEFELGYTAQIDHWIAACQPGISLQLSEAVDFIYQGDIVTASANAYVQWESAIVTAYLKFTVLALAWWEEQLSSNMAAHQVLGQIVDIGFSYPLFSDGEVPGYPANADVSASYMILSRPAACTDFPEPVASFRVWVRGGGSSLPPLHNSTGVTLPTGYEELRRLRLLVLDVGAKLNFNIKVSQTTFDWNDATWRSKQDHQVDWLGVVLELYRTSTGHILHVMGSYNFTASGFAQKAIFVQDGEDPNSAFFAIQAAMAGRSAGLSPDEDEDFQDCVSAHSEGQDELDAWLDAASAASQGLSYTAGDISLDSDVDPAEALDGLGELRSFTRPPAANAPISVIFLVDLSDSMKTRDIRGREELRRIDAVVDVLKSFIVQQRTAGAVTDLYSVITLSNSNYEVKFLRHSGSEAVAELGRGSFEPSGAVRYQKIVTALEEVAVPGQVCRAIFMSDGCTGSLSPHVLPNFQALFASNPHVVLHCIGFGPKDFSIIQQLAQIGRGSFSCASLDIENLVNTFSSLSKTVTETRNTVHHHDREMRRVAFESSHRFKVAPPSDKSVRRRPAMRFTYTLHEGDLRIRSRHKCVIQLHTNPFMQGGMRLVYRCRDADIPTEMVAKLSRYVEHDNSWDFVKEFVKNTAQTRLLTQEFHHAVWWAWAYNWEPKRLVSCAQTWVYDVCATRPYPQVLCVAEPFLKGSERGFTKWINNRGEILIPPSSTEYSMAVEAFAHFSLDFSRGNLMVADLQGVLLPGDGKSRRVHLTDPQILSLEQEFGAADLGSAAMQKFRSLHVCNSLCRRLHLSSLDAMPRAPRTRKAILTARRGPSLPTAPPPLPPKPVVPAKPERGRSPVRRQAGSEHGLRSDETLKAQELLLCECRTKAKRLLFVGECTHLFTVAAARLVALWLRSEHPRLEWCTTELSWPTSEIEDEIGAFCLPG
ncbi:Myosin heavy chain kinase C [Symbiodinium microadriaticum]|uniref:Myosin heavy chain kinase C n=1 Tax=Symbiodinium microadriaticum TaxID=2951 RepID=A0A1Q9EU32_SYMMI|nr:Myosin heavy chain kinase C [Symbiodinium microadriaticum]